MSTGAALAGGAACVPDQMKSDANSCERLASPLLLRPSRAGYFFTVFLSCFGFLTSFFLTLLPLLISALLYH
jgi:hypothetical protein